MNNILRIILINFGISIIIYFGIAAVRILTSRPGEQVYVEGDLVFSELFFDYAGIPALQSYSARDGATLSYRYYEAESSEKILVLLHGSGWHSRYFYPLADYLSAENLAHVYTPDLRGHGENPQRRGDIDYIRQYEDDVADLLDVIRAKHPDAQLIIGGHSSGGALALRFGGSQYGNRADAYVLLTPFLKYNAPTARENSGGWANPLNGRLAGLTMLNNVGIRAFNYLTVITFNMPEEARDGTETLAYTYRLNRGYEPHNYKKDLAAIEQPLLVVVGAADEAFIPEQYKPTIAQYNSSAQVELLPDVTHMGVVVGSEIQTTLATWLNGLD